MNKDFFVMLNCQNGGITPLMDGDELATYDTPQEAEDAAEKNPLGVNHGFEIFCRGCGEVGP